MTILCILLSLGLSYMYWEWWIATSAAERWQTMYNHMVSRCTVAEQQVTDLQNTLDAVRWRK